MACIHCTPGPDADRSLGPGPDHSLDPGPGFAPNGRSSWIQDIKRLVMERWWEMEQRWELARGQEMTRAWEVARAQCTGGSASS